MSQTLGETCIRVTPNPNPNRTTYTLDILASTTGALAALSIAIPNLPMRPSTKDEPIRYELSTHQLMEIVYKIAHHFPTAQSSLSPLIEILVAGETLQHETSVWIPMESTSQSALVSIPRKVGIRNIPVATQPTDMEAYKREQKVERLETSLEQLTQLHADLKRSIVLIEQEFRRNAKSANEEIRQVKVKLENELSTNTLDRQLQASLNTFNVELSRQGRLISEHTNQYEDRFATIDKILKTSNDLAHGILSKHSSSIDALEGKLNNIMGRLADLERPQQIFPQIQQRLSQIEAELTALRVTKDQSHHSTMPLLAMTQSTHETGQFFSEFVDKLEQSLLKLQGAGVTPEPDLSNFLERHPSLKEVLEVFHKSRSQLTEHGKLSLLVEQYLDSVNKLLGKRNQPNLSHGMVASPEERLAWLILGRVDSHNKGVQDAWEFIQKPYSPLKDLELLAAHFKDSIRREGLAHPACHFARACGYEFFLPTAGDRPEFNLVDVQSERPEPGLSRGSIAEVLVPGIRSLKPERVVQKAKVAIAL